MNTTPFRALALVLALVPFLSSCSKPAPAEEPVRSVKLLTVGIERMTSGSEFAGEVRARVESRLGFRVAGKLVRRQVEIGQRVRAGQVIAQLDPQDFKLAAEAMRAQLLAAVTNRDLAQADFKRYKDLKDQNFVSGAELERREATVKAANAQVQQVQAQLAAQGNQSDYTSLVADFAGLVTAIEAEPGQVVQAGATIARIAQDGPRDVVFSVPEDRLKAITTGSQVAIRTWSPGLELAGVVREIAAAADPVTRTFQVKATLAGSDPPPLGATVTVAPAALSTKGVQVIKLPTSALKQDGRTSAVWVLDPASMTVKSRPVQIAAADGNDVVVSAGLVPGMQVVIAGVHVLSAGQKVSVYKAKASVVVPANPPPQDMVAATAKGGVSQPASK